LEQAIETAGQGQNENGLTLGSVQELLWQLAKDVSFTKAALQDVNGVMESTRAALTDHEARVVQHTAEIREAITHSGDLTRRTIDALSALATEANRAVLSRLSVMSETLQSQASRLETSVEALGTDIRNGDKDMGKVLLEIGRSLPAVRADIAALRQTLDSSHSDGSPPPTKTSWRPFGMFGPRKPG
jgi:hypothetical protein